MKSDHSIRFETFWIDLVGSERMLCRCHSDDGNEQNRDQSAEIAFRCTEPAKSVKAYACSSLSSFRSSSLFFLMMLM